MKFVSSLVAISLSLAVTLVSSVEIYSIYDLNDREPRPCSKRILENGLTMPNAEEYTHDTTVHYACGPNHDVDGNPSARCVDGRWDRELPKCVAKKAPAKECERRELMFGSLNPDRKVYQNREVVLYRCDDGYDLIGEVAAACFLGKWTAEMPECAEKPTEKPTEKPPKKCTPPKILHGTIHPAKKVYNDFDVVRYDCGIGYSIKGRNTAACYQGEWTSQSPLCEEYNPTPKPEIYCTPPFIGNGVATPKLRKYEVGAEVKIRCIGSYVRNGPRRSTCGANGRWSTLPKCEIGQGCQEPIIQNGFYNTQAGKVGQIFPSGSVLIINCNLLYVLFGESSITCRSDGQWSSDIPSCQSIIITITEKGCVPPSYTHASYTPLLQQGRQYYSVGDKITFKCHGDGYARSDNYAECLETGKWSRQPDCGRDCRRPMISNGHVAASGGSFKPNSEISLVCSTGYRVIGSNSAKCLPDGRWSSRLICSESIQSGSSGCRMPSLPEGLILKNPRQPVYPYKTQLEFQCEKGFNMIGSAVSICRKHLHGLLGGFDPNPPRCERAKCGSPGKPQNGRFRDGEKSAYYFGDTVYYVCDDKHIMSGSNQITCQNDGQFNGIPPKCQPPSCRVECKLVAGRDCQCDADCRTRGDCCYDFEQHCRRLFY